METVVSACAEGCCDIIEKRTCLLSAGNSVAYLLLCEDGASCAEFGSPCAQFYSLLVRYEGRQTPDACYLRDVARDMEAGRALLTRFADATVLPETAAEIMEDLLG